MQRMYFDPEGHPVLGYPVNPGVPLRDPSGESGVKGGAVTAPDFGPAWGDAAEGKATAGLVIGSWHHTDRVSATSSTGGAWDQIFSPVNPNPTNIITHVETQLLVRGTTQAFPKYGLYCLYDDENNHAEMFLDPVYNVMATHAVVAGKDVGWQNSTLPAGFNFTSWHSLDCVKRGTAFTFYVDRESGNPVKQTRSLGLNNGQIGLVVNDVEANYRKLHVEQ
jgi:hypothetical protein